MGLRNRNVSTAFCSHFFTLFHILFTCFSHFQNALFYIFFQAHFQNAFFCMFCGKKNAFWKCAWKKCEKNAFWKCTWKKTWKKNVKKMWKKNIWTSSWEGGTWIFWGPVLLQLLCCLPNFCRLKIGEEQFKSIGSGLCRSQICLIYL